MTWLLEQPLVIILLGVGLILALGAAWSASGRQELLYAAGAALALLVAGLVIERVVVTDREAIRRTLQEIARDVKNNNHRALVQHIHASAAQLRQKADAELPNYRFTECRVTKIHKIEVDGSAEPHSAVVEFNIIAAGTFKVSGLGELSETVPRWVKLQMLREKDGRWTVADYEHDSPERMIMER
jgi:hypothetical protein